MNSIFKLTLISHIFLGLLGIILFYAVLMVIIKAVDYKRLKFLKRASLFGFLSFVLSWISGGYYYLYYYGDKMKPIIKAGKYPWAHSIIMETKEHIFLFLPSLTLLATLIFWFYGESLIEKPKLKNAVAAVSLLIVIIGIAVALAGVLISGAVSR